MAQGEALGTQAMSIPDFPFRRDIRPVTPEGLGEHVDRQFEKIETALYNLNLTGGSGGSGATLDIDGGGAASPGTPSIVIDGGTA